MGTVVSTWVKSCAHQNTQPRLQRFTYSLIMVDSRQTRLDIKTVSASQYPTITQSHGTQFGKSTRLSLVLCLSGSLRNRPLVATTEVNSKLEVMVKLRMMFVSAWP